MSTNQCARQTCPDAPKTARPTVVRAKSPSERATAALPPSASCQTKKNAPARMSTNQCARRTPKGIPRRTPTPAGQTAQKRKLLRKGNAKKKNQNVKSARKICRSALTTARPKGESARSPSRPATAALPLNASYQTNQIVCSARKPNLNAVTGAKQRAANASSPNRRATAALPPRAKCLTAQKTPARNQHATIRARRTTESVKSSEVTAARNADTLSAGCRLAIV